MTASPRPAPGPDPVDVAELTHLLDIMGGFASNEQRARYLLSSNWLERRGGVAAMALRRRLALNSGQTMPE